MVQNGRIQLTAARQFNVSVFHQQTMESPSADWKCDRFAPLWASTFHYPTPRPPAHYKRLEIANPERNSITAAAFACHSSSGHYPNSKKPSTCCSAA